MKTNESGAGFGTIGRERSKLLAAASAIALIAVCVVIACPVDGESLGDSITVDADATEIDANGFKNLAVDGTITLQNDYILTGAITPTNSLTIDLNGHVINAQNHSFVQMSSLGSTNTITVKDSSSEGTGAIKNTGSSMFRLYGENTNGGNLIIESGTFYSDYCTILYSPIGSVLNSKLTITGGVFLNDGTGTGVWLGNQGVKDVAISNAMFTSTGSAIPIYLGSNTNATIDNCKITADQNTAVEIKAGAVSITDSTITSGVYDVSNEINHNGSGGAAATININNAYCDSAKNAAVSVTIDRDTTVTTTSNAAGATPIIAIADRNSYPISVSWQNHDISDVTVGYNDSSTSLISFNGSSLANSADTLKRALTKGGAIELTADITTSECSPFFVSSSTTIDGNGHSVTSTNNEANARVFTISGNDANHEIASGSTVTFNDIRVVGPTVVNYTRGITVHYTSNLTLNINGGYVSAGSYAINIGGDNTGLTLNVTDSTATGWCAFQTHSLVTKANFKNCELIGTNTQQNPASNSFSTIVINKDAPNASEASGNIVFEGCNITAVMTQAGQSAIDMRSEQASVITLKDCDVDVSRTTYPMFIIADTNKILIEETLDFKGTGLIYGGGLSGGSINMDLGDVLQFSAGSGYSGTILGPDGNSLTLDTFEAVELTTITAGSLSISGSWSGEMIVSGDDVTITGEQSADTKIIVKPQEDGTPSNVTWKDFEQNDAQIEYRDLEGNEAEPSEVANQIFVDATFDDETHTGTSYSVSVKVSGGNGFVSGMPETVADGGSFTFSFSSASGYEIGTVTCTDASNYVVSGTTSGTVMISGVTGPVNVVVTFVESAASNVPVDDDDDLPPFIPTQPQQDDDTTTIVACAAAAVVAALMAVFLIMEYRKR